MRINYSNQHIQNYSESRNFLILFLLWPFLAFLLALKNYNLKEAKKVVYIFLIYYGINFVLGSQGMDSERYAQELKITATAHFSNFFEIIGGLYSAEDSVDIYQPLITFIVSRFTSDHRILFAVFAAVFGFFYLKSINQLFNRYEENPNINALLYLIFFAAILPITTINGVRMWTAAWIFFYGAINTIWYRNPKYLLLAFISPMIHWSFLSACVILLIYYIVGNRNYIYLPITLASFILPRLISPFIQIIFMRLGGSLQERYEGYSNEDFILGVQDISHQNAWFVNMSNELIFYYTLFAMIVVQIGFMNIMIEKKEKNLFSFLLLFLAFVNFGKPVPTMGNRFQTIFLLFSTLYLFMFFMNIQSHKIKLLALLGLFPMLLYVAVAFRIGADSINLFIFTPGLGLPLLAPSISLGDFLFH